MNPLKKLSELKRSVKGRAKPPKVPGGMNRLEKRYADHLESMRVPYDLPVGQTGTWLDVVRWDYEPEKLRLADGAWYTPDFRVILRDGSVEFHETKGFMREAAHVRLKVAADQHPYVFRLVRWVNKQWDIHTL